MSTISPVFSSEPVLANHVPDLQTGFTPWDDDTSDLFSFFNSSVYPVEVNPGLEKPNSSQIQNQSFHNSGLRDKPLNRTGSNLVSSDKDERRKKRKLSNRKSAQRSRIKKQKHLEDVRRELSQLKIQNRELINRLRYVLYHCQRATIESDGLRLEHDVLHEKLLNIRRQALVTRQIQQQSSTCATWSCINSTVVTVQQNPSMIRDHVI